LIRDAPFFLVRDLGPEYNLIDQQETMGGPEMERIVHTEEARRLTAAIA
jgi:hypothetical protein